VLKKTITYEDFNGETVSEDFFFHLSKAELVELEMSHEGGLSASLQRIVDAEDGKSIIAEFKNIILSAYGKKSADGRRFIKNQELREEFESTEAYSTLFMELVTDTDAAIKFINGVIPAGMAEEAAELVRTENKPMIASVPEPETVTKDDLVKMNQEELKQLGTRLTSGEVKLGE
jgi:vacuolar-type H+-ATPase subunit F/Vma7